MIITPIIIIGLLALLCEITGRPADELGMPNKSNVTVADNEIDSNDTVKTGIQLTQVVNETTTTQTTTVDNYTTTILPTNTLSARVNTSLELMAIDDPVELITSTEKPRKQKKTRMQQNATRFGRQEHEGDRAEGEQPPMAPPGGSNPVALLAAIAGSSSGGMMPGNGTGAEGGQNPLAGILGGLLGALGGASGPMEGQVTSKLKKNESNYLILSEIRLPRQENDDSYENSEIENREDELDDSDIRTELTSDNDSDERVIDSMAAGDGDDASSSDEEPPGGGDGEGGGLLGALAGLSGGDGDSDLGTLLATVGGIVASLSGDGVDFNSLIASGVGLFAGLSSDGTSNPGEVVASYIITTLESITGGGAMNNGAFIGKFITTLLAGSSAPDDESVESGDASQGSDSGSFLGTVVGSILGTSSG